MRTGTFLALALAFTLCITSCEKEGGTDEMYEIEGVALNISTSELAIGDTLTLSAKVLPYGLDPASIKWEDDTRDYMFWKSDNPKVATVTQNGLVKAVGKGSCTIQFICGTYAAKCSVVVRDFDVEILYGQWTMGNGSFYFHYDGTGTVNDETSSWTFDGMRLSIVSAGQSTTYIVVSVQPGRINCYESGDTAKVLSHMDMTAKPVTLQDLSKGLVQVDGKDGAKYDAIDLGLENGVLWSTCNLMASSPDETGSFYAWGETEPKQSYLLDNYKWYNTSGFSLTKYRNADDGRFITLEAEDDAANVNMGGEWRIPTNQEIIDLCNKCYAVWGKLNDADGILFISKQEGHKGNTVFLPLAGLKDNYYQSITSSNMLIGFYWSSTLSRSDDFSAYYFQLFNMPESDLNKTYYADITTKRYSGACIRPVVNQ